ncbi:MAG: hypothetical protein ABIK28_18030 [Planctomycetota bacterium]
MTVVVRRTVIGVMGGADPDMPAVILRQAEETGRLIALSGAVLLCGGRSGIMEAVARGAKSVLSGETVAILPGPDINAANPYMDIVVATAMGNGRNVINVLSSDSIIAFPGGAGTLSEMALAIKNGIHTISFGSWDLRAAASDFSDGPLETFFHIAHSPEEAVRKAGLYAKKTIPDPDVIVKTIKQLLETRAKSWNARDAEAFLRHYLPSQDLMVTIQGQYAQGIDAVEPLVRRLCTRSEGEARSMDPVLKRFSMTRLPGGCVVASYDYGGDGITPWNCTSYFAPWAKEYRVVADHL